MQHYVPAYMEYYHGGRWRPCGCWALEKYARTAATFKTTKLEADTKHRAQAGNSIMLEWFSHVAVSDWLIDS